MLQLGKDAHFCPRCECVVWVIAAQHERDTAVKGYCEACVTFMRGAGHEVFNCIECGVSAWIKIAEYDRFGERAYCDECVDQMRYVGYEEIPCSVCGTSMWARKVEEEYIVDMCESCDAHLQEKIDRA